MSVTVLVTRPSTGGVTIKVPPPPPQSATGYLTTDLMGAPLGIATLDANEKIERSQIQMAFETEAKFEEIDEALADIEIGAPEPGDGIRIVGDVVNIDITTLTLAP